MVNKVSQRGSRTNERSIRYGEDLNVSDVTEYPKTVLGPVPYPLCPIPVYDVGSGQKLESLELYDYPTLFQYPCIVHTPGVQ